MTRREMVCTCEDVTRTEILKAIAAGHKDMESVKRYTGLGTGICQGRLCLGRTAAILAGMGAPADRLAPTTMRPPVVPTPLRTFAADGPLPEVFPSPSVKHTTTPPYAAPIPPDDLPSLPERASVVIIGGGIMGVGTAYHLARNGVKDVVVLDRSYLNAGASGRNGGGIREQFSTEQNITLMQQSIRLCRRFAKDMGVNIWLRQGGYLFVTRSRETTAKLERNIELQNRLGVPTRLLTPAQMREIVPQLHVDDLVAGAFNPEDGVIFPWPFVWGYAARARELGAHIAPFTEATGISVQAGRVCGVETSRGAISCDLVVNAAAAWAPQIARMAGVKVPNRPERHEILVTDSLKPFLGPLVSELDIGLYFSQSMRGEIVGGITDKDEPPGLEMRSSLRFVTRMSRALIHRMPRMANMQVVRQWAGCYDVTPDHKPIVGEVDGVAGFFQLHGFVGHGFMMAPAVTKIVGEYLAKGIDHPFVHENRLARFAGKTGGDSETMIIG